MKEIEEKGLRGTEDTVMAIRKARVSQSAMFLSEVAVFLHPLPFELHQ